MTDILRCQDCGKQSDNILDTQEWIVYEDVGGYGSIIGDMVQWKLVLCQECTVDNLIEHIEITGEQHED